MLCRIRSTSALCPPRLPPLPSLLAWMPFPFTKTGAPTNASSCFETTSGVNALSSWILSSGAHTFVEARKSPLADSLRPETVLCLEGPQKACGSGQRNSTQRLQGGNNE